MNGNEMHGGENVTLCAAINILRLDEPLEYNILFWLVGSWGGGSFNSLKFIVALQWFPFSLEGNVWLFPFLKSINRVLGPNYS